MAPRWRSNVGFRKGGDGPCPRGAADVTLGGMWPFRPNSLRDIFTGDELEMVLEMATRLGTSATLIERSGEDVATYGRNSREERARPDPFCTFFRRGQTAAGLAFRGADSACAQCEAKLALRGFEDDTGLNESTPDAVGSRRCHMGLTDYRALVRVGGCVVGAVVAGRVVSSDDDRHRIRKIVGKLGKLTRAEAAGNEDAKPSIEPVSEAARDELVREIESIPVVREGFPDELTAFAEQLGTLAGNHYRGRQLMREESVLEKARSWDLGGTFTAGAVAARARAALEALRHVLGLEFLALFAPDPRRTGGGVTLALMAQAGLDVSTRPPPLELRWDALPTRAEGTAAADFGRDAVSKTIRAVVATAGAPVGLKDKVTKSRFFYPVELGSGSRGALAFGAPRSAIPAVAEDYEFLARLSVTLLERYEALALLAEQRDLRAKLERREERVGTLQREASGERARRKEIELKRNYSQFDIAKLLEARLREIDTTAVARGVSIDGRAIGERLSYRGDRQGVTRAIDEMLSVGVEQSHVPGGSGSAAPLRVYIKRTSSKFTIGVEAVGAFLSHAERMQLMGLPAREPSSSDRAGPSGHRLPPKASAEAAEAIGVPPDDIKAEGTPPTDRLASVRRFARRHGGRFRLRSDRLRRAGKETDRWLATNALLLELPFAGKGTPRKAPRK